MDNSKNGEFGIVDYTLFGVTMFVSLAIGLYFAVIDRKKETDNYMYGNRKMPAVAVALSMAMTFQSALGIISFPAEMYLYGAINLWSIIGYVVGLPFVAHYYIPFYRNLQINSVYEILYMGICVYIPALTLNAVTPIPLTWSILGTSVICTVYTTLGGLKAVIWTDVLQGTILLIGALSVTIQLLVTVGGFGAVWDACVRGGRMNVFQLDLDPRIHASIPVLLVGNFVFSLQSLATTQPMVQRYTSCRDIKSSQRSLLINGVVMCMTFLFYVFTGLAMYAYYEGCDPVKSGQVSKADQAIPLLVVKIFKDFPGMAGIFISATYSASLSTVSSGVNSIAANILHDFVLVAWPNTKQETIMKINRVSSLGIGIVVLIIAFAVVHTHGTILQLTFVLYGAILGPNLAAYLFAFIPIINSKGAVTAVLSGCVFGVWVAIGKQIYPVDPDLEGMLPLSVEACGNLTQLLFTNVTTEIISTTTEVKPILEDTLYATTPYLLGFFGTVFTLFVGVVVSIVTGCNDPSKLDPDLFIPLVSDKRFPASVVKFFRFGVPEKNEYKLTSIGDFKDVECKKLQENTVHSTI